MADTFTDTQGSVPTLPPGTTVAVTGATGFIGGHLAERLARQGVSVTCLVRGAVSPRLQQIGARFRALDLAEPGPVRAALEGIEVIFHCAYDWGDTAWNHAALHALMVACRENSCGRFVHVSSFVVYQLPAAGEVTEEAPDSNSTTGYAHTKLELEREVLRATRERQLQGTVIQPTLVYGPFSRPFTIDPADMLRHGTVVLPDSGEGLCNAVYVDDVIAAMILAARQPAAIGERFLVSGPEPVTWRHFYEEIARVIGADGPQLRPAAELARESGKGRKLLRLAADPERLIRRVAQDARCRKLVQAGIGALPQGMQEQARTRMFGPTTQRRGHVHLPDPGNLSFLQSQMTIGSGKARRELGYAPQYDFAAGMAPTARYLRGLYGMEGSAPATWPRS